MDKAQSVRPQDSSENGGIQEMLENKGQGLRQWEKEMEPNGRKS